MSKERTESLPVSEQVEIALQVMGSQMYDRNGTPKDSFSEVLLPLMETPLINHNPPSASQITRRDDEQFMADFGISNVATMLEEPTQYVEKQMSSLLRLLEARILRLKAKECRKRDATARYKEIACFRKKVRKICTNTMQSIEAEFDASSSLTEQEKSKAHEAKQNEQLEGFIMLLDLLKLILDDIPDDWSELDKILQLLKTRV